MIYESPFCILSSVLHESWGRTVHPHWSKQALTLAFCVQWTLLPPVLPCGFSPQSQQWFILREIFRRNSVQISGVFSLLFFVSCFFLSITLSCKVRLPWFLSFSSLSVQLSKSTGLYLDSQCLYIGWKLFWWGKLEQSQGFPYLFPGLNDDCPLLPDVQYLANYCFIYFVQF